MIFLWCVTTSQEWFVEQLVSTKDEPQESDGRPYAFFLFRSIYMQSDIGLRDSAVDMIFILSLTLKHVERLH